jgi:hypothetical protein
MATSIDDSGEIHWRSLFERPAAGSVVEIPCANERDVVRRMAQAAKRAETHGIAINVERRADSIQIAPSAIASVPVARRPGRRIERNDWAGRRLKSRKAVAVEMERQDQLRRSRHEVP